jgi:acetyltransferase
MMNPSRPPRSSSTSTRIRIQVVMGGAGGVLLELVRDVAFAAPPINRAKAHDLIARTKAGQLMKGYRGSGALDADAYAKALVALGRMAQDLGDVLESVDVNPFLLLEEGGVALDALVVLRPPRRG